MSEAARSLVTEEGFARFVAILNAQSVWSQLTKVQRDVVASRLHREARTRTLRALEERGLVCDGQLTSWGDFVRVTNHKDAVTA